MDTIKINKASTKLIAHRGLSGLETENSIPAFVAAGNRSYYGVETDVHVTKDGRFIILHDDSTGRVAWDDIPVEKSRYSLVRKIRLKDLHPVTERAEGCGHIHERQDMILPSLAEYISICKKYEKTCILELKNEFDLEDIRRLVEEIRTLGYLEHVTFISFALNNMRNLRELLPDQDLYYLCGEYNEDILKVLKQYQVHLDIYYKALTREIVERLHREGILVNCWTCDDREAAEQLASWGVDFITTNLLE